jgi:hypothetical protein
MPKVDTDDVIQDTDGAGDSSSDGNEESSISRIARACFEVDGRSLVLYRLALGLMVAWDVFRRLSTDNMLLMTDAGLPRNLQLSGMKSPEQFSIYFAAGTWSSVLVLGTVHGIVALLFALGMWPKATGPMTWMFQVSSLVRMYHAGTGGDTVAVQLLMWCCLLQWSVGPQQGSRNVLSWAAAGACLLIPVIYTQSGILKIVGKSHFWHAFGWNPWMPNVVDGVATNGTVSSLDAVAYTLCIDVWVMWPGRLLRTLAFPFPLVTQVLTATTLFLESMAAPSFLLLPAVAVVLSGSEGDSGIDTGQRVRGVLAVLFAGFIIGLGLVLPIGLFPWAMTIGLAVHIPGTWWDNTDSWSSCLASRMLLQARKVAAAIHVFAADMDFVVAPNNQTVLDGVEAVVATSPVKSRPPAETQLEAPSTTRKKSISAPNPLNPIVATLRRVKNAFARTWFPAFVLCLVTLLQIDHVVVNTSNSTIPGMNWVRANVVQTFGVQQMWGMFTKGLDNAGGWAEMEGTLADGTTNMDVLRSMQSGILIQFDPNQSLEERYQDHPWRSMRLYQTQRWHMFWQSMRYETTYNYAVGNLICNLWNDDPATQGGKGFRPRLAKFSAKFHAMHVTAIDTEVPTGCVNHAKTSVWFTQTCNTV